MSLLETFSFSGVGLYIDLHAYCIQSSHFPAVECPIEGQVFTECGTACPPTCADEPGPKICTLQCVVGCQCPAGTVLDEVANRCVTVEKCSKCS